MSIGLRYHTLPSAGTPPICFTYTLNPLVGHMSTAYVAQVSKELAMCSRYDFSIYSYESDLALGFEYRTKNDIDPGKDKTQKLEGLIKARIGFTEVCIRIKDERMSFIEYMLQGLALMWEGRLKNTLFSIGLTADLSSRSSPIRTIGLEMQYFS